MLHPSRPNPIQTFHSWTRDLNSHVIFQRACWFAIFEPFILNKLRIETFDLLHRLFRRIKIFTCQFCDLIRKWVDRKIVVKNEILTIDFDVNECCDENISVGINYNYFISYHQNHNPNFYPIGALAIRNSAVLSKLLTVK